MKKQRDDSGGDTGSPARSIPESRDYSSEDADDLPKAEDGMGAC